MGAESAASCALHSAPAVATCTYCGDFLCLACAVRPDDLNLPYCVECLKRREAHLSAEKLGDRSTHGVAHSRHRTTVEPADDRGCVISAVGQAEPSA